MSKQTLSDRLVQAVFGSTPAARAVSFTVSPHEAQLIQTIVQRAFESGLPEGLPREFSRLSLSMDLTAVHANGCPLRLAELLRADRFNFDHDVYGIQRHLNRETGQLDNCFVPRFAVPERL